MEITQLRHFVAVAETGSFTRGAERASVTQPAISASLAKLEAELGVRLFERTRREVKLTAAGLRVREVASGVLSACASVKSELRSTRVVSSMRCGVVTTLPIRHVGGLVRHFRQTFPDSSLELVEGTATELEKRLVEGRLDLALTFIEGRPARSGTIRSSKLFTERYVLVVPAGHRFAAAGKVRIENLHGEPFITRTGCETFRKTTDHFIQRGILPRVVYRTDQDERAIAMVRAGLGVALMPESYRHAEVVRVPVEGFPTVRTIGLKWRRGVDDEFVRRFLAFAANQPWTGLPRPQVRRSSST